ncbi:MAG: hypothetical protein CM15mP74_18760 [Halieaceae bacterium]|nr:MAG: hypothetical protein CM15mP74_18760 [Halieaceae bacterium]
MGFTGADGSLLADLTGAGARTVTVDAASGSVSARFSAGSGQLVDAIAQIDQGAFLSMSILKLRASPSENWRRRARLKSM